MITDGIGISRYPDNWGAEGVQAEVAERSVTEWWLHFGNGTKAGAFDCRGEALEWWDAHKDSYSPMLDVSLVSVLLRVTKDERLYK